MTSSKCPECGRGITVGYMCADCADRITTDFCYESVVKAMLILINVAGFGLLAFGVLVFAGFL